MEEKVCRLCLSNGAKVNIFENVKIDVFAMIQRCCPIIILLDDGFPQKICKKCLKTLGVCDNFLMKCIESDKQLKESNITMQVGYIKVETTENDNYMNDDDCLEDQYMENDFKDIKAIDIEIVKAKTEDIPEKKIHSSKKSVKKDRKVNDESNCKKLVKCVVCNKILKQHSLKRHMYIHSTGNIFKCVFCPKNFKVPRYLKNHINSYHLESKFSCDTCEKKFTNEKKLKVHRTKSHTNLVCEICKGIYKNKLSLICHLRTHSKKDQHKHVKTNEFWWLTKFVCDICNKEYKIKKSLIMHLERHRMESEKAQNNTTGGYLKKKRRKASICPICGKLFTNITRHIQRHTDEKNFLCPYCPQAFTVRDWLTKHVKRHEARQFTCDHCNRVYWSKRTLRMHINSKHLNNGKEYKCDMCMKNFNTKDLLSKHKWTHTHEKTYSCKYCEKSFASTKSRLEHERLHLGIKPYKCPCCSKAFTQLSNMKSHFKYNHRDIVLSDVYKAKKPGPKLMKIIPETDIQVTQFETIENCSPDLT